MNDVDILLVKESIFKNNDERAKVLRDELTKKNLLFVNVMSSPGSGKTTTLCAIIEKLKKDLNIAVMEADIDSDCDARLIKEKTGARVIQLHTGGMCHLDSDMTRQGLDKMGIDGIDLCFLENIGNLVCPAEFDTGAHLNMVILSIPEGDDKPIKYPLMFQVADIVVINKIDTLPIFDFDINQCIQNIQKINKKAKVFLVSAKTKEGISELSKYLALYKI
ncbi:hydrogenase nickel incorporation protein HypB [Anaeroplasma bactoclasticum]|jgi:hydrogenase nickel incorporation protein HypB|uniref:Hydrogenase nickel incorporation protein HypB n=1 Tax=Anaeroplasma bactoclasticum TaxID=2088 RepID=A0A397RZP4_9MOLU|nr:hydrogenase nickel incorporation protein HypB [Anaeroplasma bactoclasticum]RIA75821.1 hydrogenase nickel incorporation protein HypB [Anaeroplasma bactoclasticum]